MDTKINLLFLALYFSSITGQLVVNLKNDYDTETENATVNSMPPQPTKIISNGKLCDPNVQQHSGYINFNGVLGEKSYFFWLLESRSNPSTDPLVIWLTGGPGIQY